MLLRRLLIASFLAAFLSSNAHAADAEQMTTNEAVIRLFEKPVQTDWFTQDFLAAVPPAKLDEIIGKLKDAFGPLVSVEGTGQQLTVLLESAEVPTQITLDAEGKIAGLFFASPEATGGTLQDYVSAIANLPGATALLVISEGAVVAEHDADEPLAVASTFKLAILSALRSAYTDGLLSPETVVSIDERWKSLPSGVMQSWPAGMPVTLATLATQMISISDNTATDALVHIIGREAIAAISPRNTPVPTTADIFKLNAPQNVGLLTQWQQSDESGRHEVLEKLAEVPLPAAGDISSATATAEWFLTVQETCALLEDVADDPAFSANPGLTRRGDWQSVAFKGGSDNGVLNFSTRVVDAAGKAHCVSATWNDGTTLDTQKLSGPYLGIMRALRGDRAAD